ncbi:MAG: IS1595 family transposase [Planctomycetota bacterium]
MEDYPRALLELEERFSTDQACREYLFSLRWPDGFVCPRCGGQKAWPMSRGLWLCGQCRHQTSVTAGTIFQDTHLPLRLWFRAIWQVTSQKNGASALTVQRTLGLGSYKTAWTWLHKLRRAMVRPGRDRLSGRVEVDETYWGAPEEGVVGRLTHEKALIMVAAQEEDPRIGRIRMARVADLSRKSLHGFIGQAAEPGSTVVTDGLSVYDGLKGYRHEPIVLAGTGKTASELLPRVHRVVSLLKRWLMGTLHGGVQPAYLDYYLDEFTFRFNRRTSASRGKLFYRLLQQAVQVGPTTYQDIVSPPPVGGG